MNRFRYYTVIILLAFFMLGTIAASAMASCEFSPFVQNSTSINNTSHDGASDYYSSAIGHDRHEENIQHHNPFDKDSDSSNCYNCNGSLCQTQSLAPVLATHNFFDSLDTIHIDKEINLKTIFLARIPEPPKQLS